MIEQWTTDAVTATCSGMMAPKPGFTQDFYDTRVRPYLDSTVKGFVWCKMAMLFQISTCCAVLSVSLTQIVSLFQIRARTTVPTPPNISLDPVTFAIRGLIWRSR